MSESTKLGFHTRELHGGRNGSLLSSISWAYNIDVSLISWYTSRLFLQADCRQAKSGLEWAKWQEETHAIIPLIGMFCSLTSEDDKQFFLAGQFLFRSRENKYKEIQPRAYLFLGEIWDIHSNVSSFAWEFIWSFVDTNQV